MSIGERILARMDGADDADVVWISRDFLDMGEWTSVYSAMKRLVNDGALRRVGEQEDGATTKRGLYHRPRVNRLTRRETVPTPSAVVGAIARRDNLDVLVDQGVAANLVGLTPLQPTRQVHHTNKNVPPVDLGGTSVSFKVAAPSKMFWAGRPGMMAHQAMTWAREILTSGDVEGRDAAIGVLRRYVSEHAEVRDDLVANVDRMPRWMREVTHEVSEPAFEPEGSGMTI